MLCSLPLSVGATDESATTPLVSPVSAVLNSAQVRSDEREDIVMAKQMYLEKGDANVR